MPAVFSMTPSRAFLKTKLRPYDVSSNAHCRTTIGKVQKRGETQLLAEKIIIKIKNQKSKEMRKMHKMISSEVRREMGFAHH